MNLNNGRKWSFQPFPGSDLKIGSTEAPNWFWRLTQRAILGFVWTKQEKR